MQSRLHEVRVLYPFVLLLRTGSGTKQMVVEKTLKKNKTVGGD
jgi:hypothetical protein